MQKCLSAASAAKLQPSLSSFVSSDQSAEVTRSELLFMSFLVDASLSATDHAGALFKQMFPDSELAKQYGSARTKTL